MLDSVNVEKHGTSSGERINGLEWQLIPGAGPVSYQLLSMNFHPFKDEAQGPETTQDRHNIPPSHAQTDSPLAWILV